MKAQLDYPPTPPHLITSLETQNHGSEQTGLPPESLSFHKPGRRQRESVEDKSQPMTTFYVLSKCAGKQRLAHPIRWQQGMTQGPHRLTRATLAREMVPR